MEQPARKHAASFDPRVDDPAWRDAQGERMREFVREYEAEHGPVDPKRLAELRAQAESLSA